MAFKDHFLSVISTHRTKDSSSSSSASSSSSSSTKASKHSSSSSSSSKSSTSSSSTSTLFGALRRSNAATNEALEQWVDPPLKYSDPPQQEYVDLLASWDWDAATRRRRGSSESCVSPGTSRRGSWI